MWSLAGLQPSEAEAKAREKIVVVTMLCEVVPSAVKPEETPQEAVATLLDAAQQSRSEVEAELSDYEPYAG